MQSADTSLTIFACQGGELYRRATTTVQRRHDEQHDVTRLRGFHSAVRLGRGLLNLLRCGMQRVWASGRAKMATKSINLVLDWDGTLTKKDTMFAFGRIAEVRNKRQGLPADLKATWDGFGKAYVEDYAAYEAAYEPKARFRTDAQAESAWLKSLASVEVRSAARVQRVGFLCGVKAADIGMAARQLLQTGEVALRPGWHKLLAMSESADEDEVTGRVSIVSVNWSETWIRSALKEAAQYSDTEEIRDQLHARINSLPIVANELARMESVYGSTGRLSLPSHPSVRTSYDKLVHFKRDPDYLNVYIGDSATDFDPLLAADVGICICDEPMGSSQRTLADTLARVGCEVTHVGQASVDNHQSGTLLWARDLDEVYAYLLRAQRSTG